MGAGSSRPAYAAKISSSTSPLPDLPLGSPVTTSAMIVEDVLTVIVTTTNMSGARYEGPHVDNI